MKPATTRDTARSRLVIQLEALVEPRGRVLKISTKDTLGPLIGRLFVWQETEHYAKERLKETWKEVYDEGIIPSDDALREAGYTSALAADSAQFSIITEVGTPQQRFQLEMFITEVAHRFKLSPNALKVLAEHCREPSKAPLKKTVVEATDGPA
jgi:hypothetical protein